MTKNCQGCGNELTKENDSEAHIFPQALGGRLAPKGILCRKCNGILNDAADLALVKAFGAWPTLLDVPRQDGKQPSRTIETRQGHKVSLNNDGSMIRRDVVYDVTPIPDGHKVVIGAGDMKTARQLLARLHKQFPLFDLAAAEKLLEMKGLPPGDEIKLSLDFSPQATFGGILTAVWLYLIHTTGRTFIEFNDLLKRIKKMQEYGGLFRYLVDGLPGLQGPEIDLGHKIIVRSVPTTGELIVYVEILGVLKVGGVFADNSIGTEIEHIYVYDLARKADRSKEFSINGAVFGGQKWRTAGLGPADADALRKHFAGTLAQLQEIYYRQRLGDTVEYDVEVVGVFKNNGSCRLKLIGENRIVQGKIADPALDEPNNIYTSALHEGAVLHVVGKPTLKDGKLHKLYVTTASLPEDPEPLKVPVPILA